MTTQLRAPDQRTAHLDQLHAQFRGTSQAEWPSCRELVERGHPFAEAYRTSRAFFDSLSHPCDVGQRLYAYADSRNYVAFRFPTLSITNQPAGWQGFDTVIRGTPEWSHYLDTVQAFGFPPETRPDGIFGVWTLQIEHPDRARALGSALQARGLPWRPVHDCVQYRLYRSCLERFHLVKEVVDDVLSEWILLPRELMEPHRASGATRTLAVPGLFSAEDTPPSAETPEHSTPDLFAPEASEIESAHPSEPAAVGAEVQFALF